MVEATRSLPPWAARVVAAEAPSRIEAAVREAEQLTSGEIVPMIVARSATVGHVLPLLVTVLICLDLVAQAGVRALHGHGLSPPVSGAILLAVVAAAWPLSRIGWVRRWLTPHGDLEAQVLRRAALEFYEAGLNRTRDATGILLFVSLAERHAVVLADQSISHLPHQTWDEVNALLISGLRQRDLGQGFVSAIRRCGELAQPHFPARPGDTNELDDALIVKE